MRKSHVLLLATLMVLPTIASSQRLEPHSFVRKPVESRQQLLNHFDEDPVVRARFSKHFGASEAAVRDMFTTLSTKQLGKAGRYQVYNYQNDGTIRSRLLFYGKSERVLADETGRPVLRLACGNPMVPGSFLPKPPTAGVVPPLDPPLFDTEVPLTPIEPIDPPALVEIVPPPLEPSPEAPIPFAPPAFEPIPIAGGGFNLFPFLGLVGIGIIVGQDDGGGRPPNPEFPAVPEPATLMALGLGALALIRRRR